MIIILNSGQRDNLDIQRGRHFAVSHKMVSTVFGIHQTFNNKSKIQGGLVLRRFVLRRFTFTTLVQSDRALPTCGASLSQLKRPFSTQYASSSFPVCTCFLFCYFSAVLLSWLWFSHPWRPSKRQKRSKNQNSWRYILSWCLLNHGLSLLQQNEVIWLIFSPIICVIFYIPNSLN